MAILAAHRVVLTALVHVLLRDGQAAIGGWAFDGRVLAVQHDMVVDVDALGSPLAASLCVWTLDLELVEHVLDDNGDGANIRLGLD